MVYMGYNFNTGTIKNIEKEPNCVQDSLSKERLNKAKRVLEICGEFYRNPTGPISRYVGSIKRYSRYINHGKLHWAKWISGHRREARPPY